MIRRKIKNVVKNYSEIEILVREATSNESWGPSNSILVKIAALSSIDTNLIQIMPIIWKRLKDTGKNWRHVYKSLILMEFLITRGNPSVSDNCRQNIHFLQTLEKFIYDDNNVDVGNRIRKRAETLVRLLKDNDLLKSERNKAAVTDMRFSKAIISQGSNVPMKYGNGVSSLSQGPSTGSFTSNENNKDYIKSEYVVPSNLIEEDLQLQIALAESEEDAKQRQRIEDIEKLTDKFKLSLAVEKNLKENETKEAVVDSTASEVWGNVPDANDPWRPVVQDADKPECHESGFKPAEDGWAELDSVPLARKNWVELEPTPKRWDSDFEHQNLKKSDSIDQWLELGHNSARSECHGNEENFDIPMKGTQWPGIEASTDSLWSDSTKDPWASSALDWTEQTVWPPVVGTVASSVDPWHSDVRALSIDPHCDPWTPTEPVRLVASSNPIPRKVVPGPGRDKSDSVTEFLASHGHLVQFDRLISGSPDFLPVLEIPRSLNGPVTRDICNTASSCNSNPFYEPPSSSNPFVSSTRTASVKQLPESFSWSPDKNVSQCFQADWASIEALDNAIVLAQQAEGVRNHDQWNRDLYDTQNHVYQAPSVRQNHFNPFLI